MNIKIPKNNQGGEEVVDIESGLVIIGANGAGKTRFGSYLEQHNVNTKRISAQRMLQISERIPKQDFEEAFQNFLQSYKNQSPVTPQNDYQQLLASIFSEESKRDSDYVKEARELESKPEIPDSIIDKIKKVWAEVFPHRKILLEKYKVMAGETEELSSSYSGAEMSDGEKVGLYLIAQVLLSSENSLIIIDEPELHLHKSLMVRLWNKLEALRSDCQFIYITHDLDFAVSKSISQKIWIRQFKGNIWAWEFIEEKDILPENLYIEVAGSRKPVLFVEGDKGSLDYKVYQIIYFDFTVIPVGSCSKVIEVVKGFRAANYLHDIKVCGIIDRDFRSNEELKSLEDEKIFSTEYSEIENIMLTPEVTDYISTLLSKDKGETEGKIKEIVKKRIEDQIETLVFKRVKSEVKYNSSKTIFEALDVDSIFENLEKIVQQKEELVVAARNLFNEAKNGDDVYKMLAVFPEKGLSNQVAGTFDLKSSSEKPYTSLALKKLNDDPELKDKLKRKLPEINLSKL